MQIAVYYICIPFLPIALPNEAYFLRNVGLILAYDFNDKLALLWQRFRFLDKTILSFRIVVSLIVSMDSVRWITSNMKKQFFHTAYITSSAL